MSSSPLIATGRPADKHFIMHKNDSTSGPPNKRARADDAGNASGASEEMSSAASHQSDVHMSAPPPQRHRAEPPSRQVAPPPGMTLAAVPGLTKPYTFAAPTYVVVELDAFDGYASTLWNTFMTLLYPDHDGQLPTPITENEFQLVFKGLLKQRLDQVYSSVAGRRTTDRFPIASSYEVPAAIANVINSIGQITVLGGAQVIVPRPADPPADPAQRIYSRITHQMQHNFAAMTAALRARNFVNLDTISRVTEGTSWWMISARRTGNPATIAGANDQCVTILSVFPEFTPADAFLACIVRRGNNGLIDGYTVTPWTIETITNANGLAVQYASSAAGSRS